MEFINALTILVFRRLRVSVGLSVCLYHISEQTRPWNFERSSHTTTDLGKDTSPGPWKKCVWNIAEQFEVCLVWCSLAMWLESKGQSLVIRRQHILSPGWWWWCFYCLTVIVEGTKSCITVSFRDTWKYVWRERVTGNMNFTAWEYHIALQWIFVNWIWLLLHRRALCCIILYTILVYLQMFYDVFPR